MSDPDTTRQPSSREPSSLASTLLALQAIDTEADQLTHRRKRSPRRDSFDERAEQLAGWERRRTVLSKEITALGATIEEEEARNAELLTHRVRLEAQLKTVIAPREAEALMHEIATIEAQRDELDVAEMAALERQSALEDALADHFATEGAIRELADQARDDLAAEEAEIDAALAALAADRERVRGDVPDAVLATYDRKRAALGVAVAPLVGKQCQGCHLELSAAEIDTVRDEAAATGVTDCPDCGRLLVVT